MSRQVRDVFALAALIAGYALLLWVYESKLAAAWGESFSADPKAIFTRDHDRERMIEGEMSAEPYVTAPEGDSDGTG